MGKLNKRQIKSITKKLKPFWVKLSELQKKFYKEQGRLQKEMNKSMRFGVKLEFFYVDGECVGIGAERYSKRKNFPLIPDSDFGG